MRPSRFAFEVCVFSKLFRRMSATVSSTRSFTGPRGKRLYAVGDVHGRLDLVDDLLGRIEDDINDRPVETAAVVFLGDLIDRGPDSAGVIERLQSLSHFPAKTLFLLGNHEEFLLRALAGEPGVAHDWLGFGGDACAESYGIASITLQALDEDRIAKVLHAAIPAAHVEFIKTFGDTFAFGDYLLVHAGIRPGVPIEQQQPRDLRWIRQPFLSDTHDHGCMVIHGHTISNGVDQRLNRIGIDTGAYQTDILTAAVIEEDDIRFLATGNNLN